MPSSNAERVRRLYQTRRAEGRCVRCGRKAKGQSRCPGCMADVLAYQARRNAALRADALAYRATQQKPKD